MILEKKFPTTTSCGRMFDAAAAILGITDFSQYEGQSPMMLEGLVEKPNEFSTGWEIEKNIEQLNDEIKSGLKNKLELLKQGKI